jgi:hypothetical protein
MKGNVQIRGLAFDLARGSAIGAVLILRQAFPQST